MTHEKIFKRADGSRVKVTVSLSMDWRGTRWIVTVERCAKGSRTWREPRLPAEYNDCRTTDSRAKQMVRDAKLAWASQEEIEGVMRELVEQIEVAF